MECKNYTQNFYIYQIQIGDFVNQRDVIGTYISPNEENKFISSKTGQVLSLAKVGVNLGIDDTLLELEPIEMNCKHPKVEHGRCIYCSQQV